MGQLNLPPRRVLGIMSGTSLDGADAVLAQLEQRDGRLDWHILERHSAPYPAALKERILSSMEPASSDVLTITQLHQEIGAFYADLAEGIKGVPELIALSGQTVQHVPRVDEQRGWRTRATLQLGEAALVLERLQVPVICDFRQSDLAAGGAGAPLVPFADLKLFGEPGVNRVIHNLGGIGNLTWLPADLDPATVLAFDTGPANCLLDEAAQERLGLAHDPDGAFAARGTVHADLLAGLLEHPYFRLAPPKSTGREEFNLARLKATWPGLTELATEDLLATLTALTAESTARAYRDWLPARPAEILVGGGGARNLELMRRLGALCDAPVRPLASGRLTPQDREALAFAVLGYYAVFGLTNTLPAATGARHAVVAGKLLTPTPA